MFKRILKLVAFICCLLAGQAGAENLDKLAVLKRVNSISQKLLVLAQQRQMLARKGVIQFNGIEIKHLVQVQSNFDVLLRLALSSRANRYPGKAEDQIVDNVMDEMWTRCLERIEELGGDDAILTFEKIAEYAQLDGADALDHEGALERLRARQRGK